MEKQQTAVDLLIDHLKETYHLTEETLYEFKKIKEIEKGHYNNTWDRAIDKFRQVGGNLSEIKCSFDDYYNETYGSKGSDENFKQFSLYEHKETITSADTKVSTSFLENTPTSSQTEISDEPHSTITDLIDGIIFEMPFIEKMKLWELINRLVNECQTEISDEEIYKEAEHKSKIFRGWTTYETSAWVMACQWYREQLKKKGNENKSNSSI